MTNREQIMQEIIQIVNRYWKFDEYQQPQSSWHDKQDCLQELKSRLAEAEEENNEELPQGVLRNEQGKLVIDPRTIPDFD